MYYKPKTSQSFCQLCFEAIEKSYLWDEIIFNHEICAQCKKKYPLRLKRIKTASGIKVWGLFVYDEAMRDFLIRYKKIGDKKAGKLMMSRFYLISILLRKHFIAVGVPSPQSNEEKRGFSASETLLEAWAIPVAKKLIQNRSTQAQKNRNKEERQKIHQFFNLKSGDPIRNRNVLLFDDVLTSGASLKAAHDLLKPYCKRLIVIALCYPEKRAEQIP